MKLINAALLVLFALAILFVITAETIVLPTALTDTVATIVQKLYYTEKPAVIDVYPAKNTTPITTPKLEEDIGSESATPTPNTASNPDSVKNLEVPKEVSPTVHTVALNDDGFDTRVLRISTGESVNWENIRKQRPQQAMVIGTKECAKVRSGTLDPGQRYAVVFEQPLTCVITDGIYTKESMQLIVE